MLIFIKPRDTLIVLGVVVLLISSIILFSSNVSFDFSRGKIGKTEDKISEETSVEINENSNVTEIILDFQNETENQTIIESKIIEVKEYKLVNFSLSYTGENEEFILTKKNKELNSGEYLTDVFGEYITDENLPVFLGSGSENFGEYEKKVKITNAFRMKIYLEGEDDDKIEVPGFKLDTNDLILSYIIKFSSVTPWEDLDNEKLTIFGKTYTVYDADYDGGKITLFDYPKSFTFRDDEEIRMDTPFGNLSMTLSPTYDNGIILNFSGFESRKLYVGDLYRYENFYVLIKNIYINDEDRSAKALVTVSPGKTILYDQEFEHDGEFVKGISTEFLSSGEDSIEEIIIHWELQDDFFLNTLTELSIPFFNNFNFTLSPKRVDMVEDYWEVYLNAKTENYEWN